MQGFVFGAAGEASQAVLDWVDLLANMGAERSWKRMGARTAIEAKGLIRAQALKTLGIVAVRENARLKLDRLGVLFGSEGGAAERRATDRFAFDEQRRFRRELGGHRRSQRFNGWRAARDGGG